MTTVGKVEAETPTDGCYGAREGLKSDPKFQPHRQHVDWSNLIRYSETSVSWFCTQKCTESWPELNCNRKMEVKRVNHTSLGIPTQFCCTLWQLFIEVLTTVQSQGPLGAQHLFSKGAANLPQNIYSSTLRAHLTISRYQYAAFRGTTAWESTLKGTSLYILQLTCTNRHLLGAQMSVTGAEKKHLCTLFTPKSFIVVP